MRILLQLGAARPADQGALAPLAASLLTTLQAEGVAVEYSRDIAPDLDAHDIVHLFAAPPIDRVVRQFLHARRWGKPLVVSAPPPPRPIRIERDGHPEHRYELALWRLVLDGGDAIVALTEVANTPLAEHEMKRPVIRARLGDSAAGKALVGLYGAIVQEHTAMAGDDTTADSAQWLPGIAVEEYSKHLEDLCQLQLELIAFRDAEYDQLRHQLEVARQYGGSEGSSGQRTLKTEYERLGSWSQDLAAQHAALQADYARMQHWSGELESQLQVAARGGRLARIVNVLRRR